MKNVSTYCLIVFTSMLVYCCNDTSKVTERKLPADSMPPDVSETKKVIPVDTKSDTSGTKPDLPVANPK